MLNEAIWQRTQTIPRREPLKGDVAADVAIIGAGMAGILTAYMLGRRGVKAVILDAGRIAGGQTGRTTAKITSQHGMIYDALATRFGREAAAKYARANEQAVRKYARIIHDERIDCDFHRTRAWLYSKTCVEPMRREAEIARELGIDAHFSQKCELPFDISGAVCFEGQARFNPLKFLAGICEGIDIYEDTRVLTVEGKSIKTERGNVRAGHIVFAAHFPFINFPGWYFMRMHQERSYVLALESDWLPRDMYIGVDDDGLSFREADGFLLLGGGAHRTGENTAGGRYDMLRERARALLPGAREAGRWSAQDCIAMDGIPYIGRFSSSAPDWHVATGFGKWGMSSSMAAAMLISGDIAGESPDWADVFSPERFRLSASAQSLATDTAQAFKGLTKGLFYIPESTLDALPAGHGGIIEENGRKAGVYKDENGECHIIDPRCPHLGCQLEWNPDELSWDCPCHGSRFDYDGRILDGPAQEDLKS
jgi:glycine/D-amino acid oxidase-like deaminating enzyme/nitrite reductase/ring-hydroxylating ferredoxin subunit